MAIFMKVTAMIVFLMAALGCIFVYIHAHYFNQLQILAIYAGLVVSLLHGVFYATKR
jgi:hypothetical protein